MNDKRPRELAAYLQSRLDDPVPLRAIGAEIASPGAGRDEQIMRGDTRMRRNQVSAEECYLYVMKPEPSDKAGNPGSLRTMTGWAEALVECAFKFVSGWERVVLEPGETHRGRPDGRRRGYSENVVWRRRGTDGRPVRLPDEKEEGPAQAWPNEAARLRDEIARLREKIRELETKRRRLI